jgi:hypothetical protein
MTQQGSQLRSLAWDRQGNYLTVVGGSGYVGRLQHGKIVQLNSGVNQNLRALSVNPIDGTILIVGNGGIVLVLDEQGDFTKILSPSFENLRAVAWDTDGMSALIAGNNGVLMRYLQQRLELIQGGRANLRDVGWRPGHEEALVASNCFVGEFMPSPNLFTYDTNKNTLERVNESRADLIGVDWDSEGSLAIVVGYDVVWHTGIIAKFDGREMTGVEFENKRVYPTCVSWRLSGDVAAIATATSEVGVGAGKILLWDGKGVNEVYRSDRFFFSDVRWAPGGDRLAAVASTGTRAFNA